MSEHYGPVVAFSEDRETLHELLTCGREMADTLQVELVAILLGEAQDADAGALANLVLIRIAARVPEQRLAGLGERARRAAIDVPSVRRPLEGAQDRTDRSRGDHERKPQQHEARLRARPTRRYRRPLHTEESLTPGRRRAVGAQASGRQASSRAAWPAKARMSRGRGSTGQHPDQLRR